MDKQWWRLDGLNWIPKTGRFVGWTKIETAVMNWMPKVGMKITGRCLLLKSGFHSGKSVIKLFSVPIIIGLSMSKNSSFSLWLCCFLILKDLFRSSTNMTMVDVVMMRKNTLIEILIAFLKAWMLCFIKGLGGIGSIIMNEWLNELKVSRMQWLQAKCVKLYTIFWFLMPEFFRAAYLMAILQFHNA